MFISVSVALVIVAIVSLFFYSYLKQQYWSSRGVWSPKALPIFGHFYHRFIKKYGFEYMDKIYCANKEKKYWGVYTLFQPSVVITDPEIIKLILVKDASNFVDRPTFKIADKDRLVREFLTVVTGEKWKALRAIISPTFTSGKIKGTFPLISESVETLLKNCTQKMEEDGFVDMKTLLGYYSMDVITTCAFGIKVDCCANNDSKIVKACYNMLTPRFSLMRKDVFYLEKCILETVKNRQENKIKRGDFLDLLLEALKNHEENTEPKENKYPMTMNTIVSTGILFILAGFDTTSTTLSFITYLLAKNTECQENLRRELQEIRNADGELNYKNIMEAKYLDGCVFETLRMYGPAHFLDRVCTQEYKVPSHDLTIPKDMVVGIPSWSMHYDPQYWDEPRTFRPERFFLENKQNINQYAFLSFGLGPRNCVGMRFALLETKMAIAHLVLNFKMNLKPGFELVLNKTPSIIKADSNGIQVTLESLDQHEIEFHD